MRLLSFILFFCFTSIYSQTGKSTTDYSEIDNIISTRGEALLIDMQYNFFRQYIKKYDIALSGFYFTSKYFIPKRKIKVEMYFKESLKTYMVSEYRINESFYNIEEVIDTDDKKVHSYEEFIKLFKKEKAVFVSFYENEKELLNVTFSPNEEDIDYTLNYKL